MDIEAFIAARNHVAEKMNHEPNLYRTDGDTRKAAAVYAPLALAFYDLAVLEAGEESIFSFETEKILPGASYELPEATRHQL